MTADGIRIAVRVTPRASRASFGPDGPDRFAARVAAPPVDGAANAAVIALVAERFGVGRRSVTLVAGEGARLKRLHVAGDPEALAERAASLYGNAR